jgi:hypothetical protein
MSLLLRSFDAERLNYLVNHPEVRPTAGGDGQSYIDLSPFVPDEANHFLGGEHGGVFWHWTAPDTYEAHIFILPEGRGRWALDFAAEAIGYIQDQGAVHLWARVSHRHTQLFTLRVGFKPRGERTFDFGTGPVLYKLYDWRSECPQH